MCVCVCVWPRLMGSCGCVGVVGMCELMLVSAYVWEVDLWLCISTAPEHTYTQRERERQRQRQRDRERDRWRDREG